MRITPKFCSGVWNWKTKGLKNVPCDSFWTFQILIPHWSVENRDFYIMAPSTVRFMWNSRNNISWNTWRDYGGGLVVAGFGFAIIYTKVINQTTQNQL